MGGCFSAPDDDLQKKGLILDKGLDCERLLPLPSYVLPSPPSPGRLTTVRACVVWVGQTGRRREGWGLRMRGGGWLWLTSASTQGYTWRPRLCGLWWWLGITVWQC